MVVERMEALQPFAKEDVNLLRRPGTGNAPAKADRPAEGLTVGDQARCGET